MKEKKNNQLNIRLSDRQMYCIQRLSEDSNLTVTEYVLKSCLNNEIIVVSIENMEAIFRMYELQSDILLELKRQGVNINQIAYQLNSQQQVDHKNFGLFKSEYEKVYNLFESEMKKIGAIENIGSQTARNTISYSLLEKNDEELDKLESEINKVVDETEALKVLELFNKKERQIGILENIDIVSDPFLSAREKLRLIENKGLENMTEDEALFMFDHASDDQFDTENA